MSKKPNTERYLKIFCDLVEQLKRVPSNQELTNAGAKESSWKAAFSTFRHYEKCARRYQPKVFGFQNLEDVKDRKVPRRLRYSVTTSVSGHPLFKPGLGALKSYQEHTKAQPLTLVCGDPASNATLKSWARAGYYSVDNEIAASTIVIKDRTRLNDNLLIHEILTSAKQIDPTTGTLDLAQKYGTCIFASPKQRLKMVPTYKEYPRAVMTTGAITHPSYATKRYMSKRTEAIAEADHVMGALIVEVDDETRFHYRQVQFQEDGSFVDLGTLYHPTRKPKRVKVDLVLGDLHVGREDQIHKAAKMEMIEYLKPRHIVLHDVLDGVTISYHDKDKMLTRSQREMDVRAELRKVRNELKALAATGARVIVVKSNHDTWLDKWIDAARWARDPLNFEIGHRLTGYALQGRDPLAAFCNLPTSDVLFLQKNESFVLSGVEVGYHGTKGPNGSAPSAKNLSYSMGKAIVGHNHSPEIWRSIYRVGTCAMDMDYTEGPSSWCQTHCILDEFGGRQLVNVIDGEWRLTR